MSAEQGSVVVIGDALIDEIRDERGVRELIGGAALNVAVGLRRLGVDTVLIAMVGDDEAGEHIRQHLRDHDVRLIASPSALGSSRAIVSRSASGEPEYRFNAAAQARSIRYGAEARAVLEAAVLVVVSCFPFDDPAEVAALSAARRTARLAVDPNPRAGMLHNRAEFVRGFEMLAARSELVKIGADDAALLYDGDLAALTRWLRERGAAPPRRIGGFDFRRARFSGYDGYSRTRLAVQAGRVCIGELPKRPKGSDCKSAVFDFGGSNPSLATKNTRSAVKSGRVFCCQE